MQLATMLTPSVIVSRIGGALRSAHVGVVSLGLFGSARYEPECRDIDVLLICETPASAKDYDYQKEMEKIARLMAGSDNNPVVDPCLLETIKTTEVILAKEIGLPVVFAFGPSPGEQCLTQATIHLNGPVTQGMWTAFAIRFPIHATSICNVFQRFLGDNPTRPSKIEYFHVQELAFLLEQRIARVGANERLVKKLLQSLGTISGAKICQVKELIEASFTSQHPVRLALKDFSLKSVPADSLCQLLLAELRLQAKAIEISGQVISLLRA
jgi:hypothetical protein